MSTYVINDENYGEAISTLKDILYMFVDAIVQGGDFSELELGGFDPFKYVAPEIKSDYGLLTDGEFNLLRKGAAIAMLSLLADVYFDDECNSIDENDKKKNSVMSTFNRGESLHKYAQERYKFLPRIKEAFESGLVVEDPDINCAFVAAFSDEQKFHDSMKVILENIVKKCFITLAEYKS